VLLRAGSLTSRIGEANATSGAQEEAKDLLSEALRSFDRLNYSKKAVEARKELALCYWRAGEHAEARSILKDARNRLGPVENDLRARLITCMAVVENTDGKQQEALELLLSNARLFEKIKNHYLKGGYHHQLAAVLQNLAEMQGRSDYRDRSILEFTAAAFHFEESGHIKYAASVENNLGLLQAHIGRFKEAHKHLDHARRLLSSIKDKGMLADVNDSRAKVLLMEARNEEAERVSRYVVSMVKRTGQAAKLAEALTTHGVSLARLGYHGQAREARTCIHERTREWRLSPSGTLCANDD
jgi:tetratricopeptide (TPR) repeat protein